MSSRKYSGILAIVASVVAFASQATVYTQYIGSDGGDFWSAANWKDGVPSATGYVARLNSALAAPCSIVLTNAPGAKFDYLDVTSGEWTLRLKDEFCFGGNWDSGGIRVGSNAKLTIVGGIITNTCFEVAGGGQIVFENVITKGCMSERRQDSSLGDREAFVFNGGIHDFSTMYCRLYQRAAFNAGDFSFGSIFGHDLYGESKQSRLPSFLAVNSGRVSVSGAGYLQKSSSMNVGITIGGNGWFVNAASGSGMCGRPR